MVNEAISDFFVYFTIYCQKLPNFVTFNYLNYKIKKRFKINYLILNRHFLVLFSLFFQYFFSFKIKISIKNI